MKTLIIDDELEVEVMAKVLRARHPSDNIDLADTLAKARDKLWSEKYDAISVDIMMRADDEAVPGSSKASGLIAGLQLVDLVKADKNCLNNKTPIVFLTGLEPSEHKRVQQVLSEYGPNFMGKPTHPDEFYETLRKVAGK
jgi:CheY-like chemotaxis protein